MNTFRISRKPEMHVATLLTLRRVWFVSGLHHGTVVTWVTKSLLLYRSLYLLIDYLLVIILIVISLTVLLTYPLHKEPTMESDTCL